MHTTMADAVSADEPNAAPTPAEDDVAFLDILDPGFRVDAQEVQRARAVSWYARTPLGYAVLRYGEVVTLLREPRLRQGLAARLMRQGITDGPLAQWWRVMILNADGDEHTRLRRLVAKAFTPPAVERLRPFMRASANELIDSFAHCGECDFVASFADRYPGQIICELLGVPAGTERERFAVWANDLSLAFGFEAAMNRARIEAALQSESYRKRRKPAMERRQRSAVRAKVQTTHTPLSASRADGTPLARARAGLRRRGRRWPRATTRLQHESVMRGLQ